MRGLLGWLLVVAVAVPAVARDRGVPVWLIAPQSGRPGVLVAQATPALEDAGFDVGSLHSGAAPRALIVYPRAVTEEALLATVLEMVREGAGLVVVYTLSPDVAQTQAALLEPWGVRLQTAERGTGETEVLQHPITRGVRNLFVWRTAAALDGVQALLRQGSNVIAGAAESEIGRLVVLPLDAVVPGQHSDPIPAPNLRLLIQATQWVARAGEQPAGDPSGPAQGSQSSTQANAQASEGEDVALPEFQVPASGSRGRFSPLAIVDAPATDESWPAIREIVVALARKVGLEPREVPTVSAKVTGSEQPVAGTAPSPSRRAGRVEKLPAYEHRGDRRRQGASAGGEPAFEPLIRALDDDPALVVIGSCREFTDAEELAVATYVEAGGAVLFLPRGTEKTNLRIVEINGILAKFGMTALLGRPAGPASKDMSRILADVSLPDRLPAGVMVTGYLGLDLVTVGGSSALRVLHSGDGRVAVVDPLPLVTSKPDRDLPERWKRVLEAVLRWLLEGVETGE